MFIYNVYENRDGRIKYVDAVMRYSSIRKRKQKDVCIYAKVLCPVTKLN